MLVRSKKITYCNFDMYDYDSYFFLSLLHISLFTSLQQSSFLSGRFLEEIF